jgi:hypothetical protein
MTRLRLIIFIFVSALFCLPVFAQSFSPQQITLAERIESVAINMLPELAYIQTSKDIYETGEDLWFKVYLLDTQSLIPSLHSKTLYLQLLEETSKEPVWEEKYEIQNGFSNVKAARGVDSLKDDEALKSVMSSPKWTPGMLKGKTVRLSYYIMVNFEL